MWGKYGKTAISAVKSLIKQKKFAIKTKRCFPIKIKFYGRTTRAKKRNASICVSL